MASVGSFGVSTPTGNQVSRETTQSAEVDTLLSSTGVKIEGTTHGSEKKISEEFFAGTTLPALEAVDGQNGATLITSHGTKETNNAYARVTKEQTVYPGAGA